MKTKIFVLGFLCLFFGLTASAQRIASVNGNWNDPATWGGAAIPTAAETVTINSGITVTVNATATALSITNNGTLNVGGFALTVTGSTTIGSTGTLNITSATGTKTFNGDVVLNSGGVWNNTIAAVPVAIAGNFTNHGIFNSGAGVYTFSGADKTIGGSVATTFANLTISGSITNTISLGNGGLTVGTALAGVGTLTNVANSLLKINGTTTLTSLIAGSIPNTVIFNIGGGPSQNLPRATYHHLVLTGSGNLGIADPVTISGDLTIDGPKVTWTGSGAMTVNGNLLVNSEFILDRSDLTVSGITTIAGTLNIKQAFFTTFNDFVVTAAGNVKINTQQTTVTITGNIDGSWNGGVKANTFNLTGTGKTIVGTIDFGSASTTNITGSYTNNGTLTFNALNVNSGGSMINNNSVTVIGNLESPVGTGTITQGVNSLLRLNGTSTVTTFNANALNNTVAYIGNTQTIRSATYHNLVLDGAGTKTAGGELIVNGDFSMNSGSASVFAYGSFSHDFYGSWLINSSASAPITAIAGSTINFKGSSAATISGTSGTIVPFVSANFSNTGGITANMNMSIASGIMTVMPGGKLTLPAATVITGSGTFDLNAGGLLEIGSTGGIAAAGATGNVQTSGRIFNTAGNYTYNGSSAQVTGTGLGSGLASSPPLIKTVNNLIINNNAGITLSNDVDITGVLTFSAGKITTNASKVIIESTASIAGAGPGKYIYGNLRRHIPSTPNVSVSFNIGDATNYTPAVIDFTGTPAGGSIDGFVTSPAQPVTGCGILQNKYVNRSWKLINNSVNGFTSYSPTFTFVGSDIMGGANTANFIVAKNSGGIWTKPTVGTRTNTSTRATGLTSFSEFIIGEPGDATQYLVSTSNIAPLAGSDVTITAQLADINGNPILKSGVVVTWSKSDVNGSFANSTSVTDANGLASVIFTTHTAAGTATTVTATDAGSLTGTTPVITTTSGAAAKYLVSSSNYAPVAGSAVTITAQLADINNNPVNTAGVIVTWSKSDLNGSFISSTSTTDANGVATVSFTTHTGALTATTVTATDAASLTGTTPTITTTSGAAAKYLVSSSNYAPVAGSAVTITAQLADINNNHVNTAGVIVTWSKSDLNGTFAATTSNTDANGVATVSFTTHIAALTATTVTATDAASLTGTTPTITTVAGAAAKYLVSSSNYTPIAGSAVTITAQLADVNNNPVNTAGLIVTWSKSDLNGTFAATTSNTDANGVATVSFTTHIAALTATTVTATDAASLTGTTPTITTTAGAAAKYLVSSSNYAPVAGSAVTITAQLADVNNNPVNTAGVIVTWSKSDLNGSFIGSTSTTDANGLATVTFTTHTAAATATTVTATDAGNLTGTSPVITTTSGAAAKYLVSSSNYAPVAGSAVTITAQLADINNNPVNTAGVIVTWSKSDVNGSFISSTSTTDANGLATVTFTTHTAAATATTVTATDAASLTGTSGMITTISGAAAKYLVSSSNYAPIAGSAVTITAQLADVNSNPVNTAGVMVTWSKSDVNGSFISSTSTTDANGVAAVAFTTHTAAATATTVTATDAGSLTGTTPTITTTSGAAARYLVSSSNYAPVAGSAVTITAQLADVNNNPVNTAGVIVTWSKSDVNGSFTGSNSTTDANGVATVAFTTHTAAATGTTVTATDAASLTGTSGMITTTAGAAARYMVSSSNYAPVAGSAVTITAQLADVNNNPVNTAGISVTWSKSDANGTFAATTSTTDANGMATVAFTTHIAALTATTVTATDAASLTGTSGMITTISGAAAKYLVSSSNYTPVAGSAVTITAQLADINNNPVNTAGLIVTWSKSDVNGAFLSSTSTTDANGMATVAFTTHTAAATGTTVTATNAGSLTGTTPVITTTSGAAAKYLVSSSNYAPVAGSAVTITAQLTDINNNPVNSAGIIVTWSKSDLNGTFAATTSNTDANGVATVTFTTHTGALTATTVTATDAASLTGTSGMITTISGAAAKYLVSSSNYTPVAGSAVTITAQLADVNNNPVNTAGVIVTWSKSDANGLFGTASSTTDANGLATVSFTTHTGALTATTVTATDAASLTGTSPVITTTSGAAAKYLVSSSNYTPVAGSAVTITAQLADVNNNPVNTAGVIVTWSKSDVNGSFTGSNSTTDANGVATVAFTTHTAAATGTTVTATDAGSLTGTTPVITTTSGAAAKYLVSSSNYAPVAGSAVTITAQLADINNNPVNTAGVIVTWSKSDLNGSFISSTSTTDANGVATVSFTTHIAALTATTVTATDAASLTGTTPTITTTAGAAAKYLVSSSNYAPIAGSAVTITAQLADVNNNPVNTAGVIVNWSKSDANGLFGTASSITDANGLATVTLTTHTAAATATTVTATDAASLTGTTATITTTSGAAAKYLVSSSNYAPVAGSAVTITAQLADVNNNPVNTAGLIVTWSKSDANGLFGTATSTTDANGVATVAFTTHTIAATATTVTATDPGSLTGTSGMITTISGAAAKYLVSSSNYAPVAGSAVTITAQLADVNNNPVNTAGVMVTWSKSDANGLFGTATSNTDANGVATVTFTTHTAAATATTVTSTCTGNLTGTSPTITTTAGAAAKYLVSSSNYAPVAGGAVTITAQLADINNNPVNTAGLIVTWSKSDVNGSFISSTSTTDANGLATVSFTTHTGAATATTVTATDAASLTGTTPTITTTSGAAAKYLVSSSNYTPIAGSAVTITAQLADVNNNPVNTAGVIVTWSKSDLNGSFIGSTSTTDANGLATVTFTTHTAAATATTITATDAGSLIGTSPVITTTSGAAAKYLVSSSNYTPVAGSAVTITAQLADVNNNPVNTAGLIVTWSKLDANGTFAATTSTTDANGVATVAFTTHTAASTATTVTATDAASLTGTTGMITTTAGAAAKYLVSSSNYAPVAGSAVTISAQLADINNNPVNTAGIIVTWSKSDANGTFGTASSTTDANGVATVALTTHTAAATATTVTATDAGSLTGTTPVITTVAGAAAKYLVSSSNYAPVAGSAVTITAQLADVNNNPVNTAGLIVTWSKSDVNGLFGTATSTTDANGVATVPLTTHTTAATATTVTATDAASLTGTTPTITTTSGAAAKYLVSSSNYAPVAGSAVTITAQLADVNNNPVNTAGSIVTWSKSDVNGSFISSTSTTDANGLATVTFTTHTAAATATTVTATDAASLTGTTPTITTTAGAAAKYLVSSSNYAPVAGSAVTITAQLADINNNPVNSAGIIVTWSKSDLNGLFGTATSTTDANGVATVALTTHTAAATATTVTATDAASLTGTTPTITTTAGAAAKYLVSSSIYAPVAGSAVTITAQLADVNDNVVNTAGLIVTWSKSDVNGSFIGSTSTTDANGMATVAFTTHTAAATGTTVTATDAASLTGTTPTITTTAGAAAKYLVSSSNYAPVAGSAVTITAQLADVNNNPVNTAGSIVTWSKSDLNGLFGTASSTTNANGVATVALTTHTAAATATTITATDAGSLTGTTPTITTTAGAAVKLVISGTTNQIAGTHQNLTITAMDANGNIVPGYAGDKNLIFTGAGVSGNPVTMPTIKDKTGASIPFGTATRINFINGVAVASAGANGEMMLYKAETAVIAVTDNTITATGNDRLTVTVVSAEFNKLAVSLASDQTSSVPFTGLNTLTAQDAFGNTVITFNCSVNNVSITTSLNGTIFGLPGINILSKATDFMGGTANLTSLGLTFTGSPATGTFTFTPANGRAVTSGDVTIHQGTRQATPTFSPGAGAIAFGTTITIISAGADAIYYTTDGTTPTTLSTNQAADPLIINSAVTVKALAVKSGSDNSLIGTASYTQDVTADLTGLVISGDPSNYTFSGSVYTYTGLTTTFDLNSIVITPTGTGTITLDGTVITSGSASAPINLTPGIEKTVVLVVTEAGKVPKTYTIKIKRALSSAKAITAYHLISPAVQGIINEDARTISLTVPFGTTLSGLIPTIVHTGSSVSPSSGSAQNFVAGIPVMYTVTAADGSAQNYAVSITYINEPPKDIFLASVPLFENQISGTLAGTLSSASNDHTNSSFTYTLVPGSGDSDNDKFALSGTEIRTRQIFDFENRQSYSIRVRSTTQQGSSFEKSFIIQVLDVNEAPTLDAIANQSICYSPSQQIISLSSVTAGPETGQFTTMSISTDNPALFKNQPAIERINGLGNQISYTIAPGQSGTATITVKVKDNGGTNNGGVDELTRTFTITVNPLVQVGIISDKGTTIARGEIAQLTATGGNSYQWVTSNGAIAGETTASLRVRPMQTTSYTVLVTNASGCTSAQTATIEVKEDFTKIVPSNNFSPNGDQINDTWTVENIDAYPDHKVVVYDRGGRIVYTTTNYKNDWDGTVNGSRLDEGTYYYLFEFNKSGINPIKGFITIVY